MAGAVCAHSVVPSSSTSLYNGSLFATRSPVGFIFPSSIENQLLLRQSSVHPVVASSWSKLDGSFKFILKRLPLAAVFAAADSESTYNESDKNIACGGTEQALPKQPSPQIEPNDIIQIQLRALRERDFATLFEFSSPSRRNYVGSLSKFTEMIQGRAYNMMLGHTSAEVLSTLTSSPKAFQQRVCIKNASGKQVVFLWSLSKQETGPLQDCWMTDSVHRDD